MSVHKVCMMHTLCTLHLNFTVKCAQKPLDSPVKHTVLHTVCSAENRKYRPLQFSLLISSHVYHQYPMCTTPKVVCTDPLKVCTKPEKCAHCTGVQFGGYAVIAKAFGVGWARLVPSTASSSTGWARGESGVDDEARWRFRASREP